MGFLKGDLQHGISGVSNGFGSCRVDTEINQGWRSTVTFANKPAILFGDLEEVRVRLYDTFANSMITPPMIARVRSKYFSLSGGWNGSFELIDLNSYKLSTGTLSFPTFSNVPFTDISAAISTACDVPINNAPDFTVWKEDIKQSDGWGPLRRGALVAGMQLIVNLDGEIEFVDNTTTIGGDGLAIKEAGSANFNALDRYTRLFVAKNLGTGTSLPEQYYDFSEPGYVTSQPLLAPLSFAVPYDMSTNGYLGWVGFWDADDQLIAIYPMGGGETDGYTEPLIGSWPAVRFSVWVYPQVTPVIATNCRLRILGIPPITFPSDIDPAIAVTYGTGRGYPQPFQENLVPSLTYANSKYLAWLREINRGTFTADVSGTMQCDPRLLMADSFDGHDGRIEKLSWATGIKDTPGTTATIEIE